MTDEQKQHYWAMFYCNAYTQIEQPRVLVRDGFSYLDSTPPTKESAAIADAMLEQMKKRWPDNEPDCATPPPNLCVSRWR